MDFSTNILNGKAVCPWCGGEFPSNEPRPSCNECECCFCSEWCRTQHHLGSRVPLAHDFSKPLAE